MKTNLKVQKYIEKKLAERSAAKQAANVPKEKKLRKNANPMTDEERRLYNNKRQREYRAKRKNGYWVYYLPDYHYCGTTDDIKQRMYLHKQQGRTTAVENHRVLYHCHDRKEAAYKEAMFQSVLAMEGLNAIGTNK